MHTQRGKIRLSPTFEKIILLLVIAALSVQCAILPARGTLPTQAVQPVSDQPGSAAETPPAEEQSAAAAEEEPAEEIPDYEPYLGSAAFTVDADARVEGLYPADGSAFQLQLTDGAGLVWTLSVPAQVNLPAQLISMTALSDISSAEIPGNLVGGVLLEPDGLRLEIPATLTVTGEALQGTTLLLGGQQDGSQVGLLVMQEAAEGASALIYHFSSYMGDNLTDDEKIAGMAKEAMAQYKALKKEAKEVLKTNIIAPTPPSMSGTCATGEEGEQNSENLKKFITEFETPEVNLVRNMLAAYRNLTLTSDFEETDFSLMYGLLERQGDKVKMLILGYGNEIEYVPAIILVAIQTARDYQLIGGSGSTDELMSMVATMVEKAIDKLLKKLVEEHDYRLVESIFDAIEMANLMGIDMDAQAEQIIQKLTNAMHFDVDLKYTFNLVGNQHWILNAGFPVEVSKFYDESVTLKGSGTGVVSSYVHDEWGNPLTGIFPDFSVNVEFKEFDACEGTAKMTIDQFYPATENYEWTDDEGKAHSMTNTLVQMGWDGIYAEMKEEGGYTFTVDIQNKNIVAVEKSDVGASDNMNGQFDGTFEIKLTHSPQS